MEPAGVEEQRWATQLARELLPHRPEPAKVAQTWSWIQHLEVASSDFRTGRWPNPPLTICKTAADLEAVAAWEARGENRLHCTWQSLTMVNVGFTGM
jgi:hypothetical protein